MGTRHLLGASAGQRQKGEEEKQSERWVSSQLARRSIERRGEVSAVLVSALLTSPPRSWLFPCRNKASAPTQGVTDVSAAPSEKAAGPQSRTSGAFSLGSRASGPSGAVQRVERFDNRASEPKKWDTASEWKPRSFAKHMPAAPAAPAVGGPPVGLGGPGNLAALNKKAPKARRGES